MISYITILLEERVNRLIVHPFALLFPLFLFLFFLHKVVSSSRKNLPPSPPKLPIIGNLHQIGTKPHHSLTTLSQKYGELMLLHFGSKPTLVISSKEMASQAFKIHDYAFSGRPRLAIAKSSIFRNCKDLIFSPYGDRWRHLRAICMLQLLTNKKVKSFRGIREEEVADMIKKIYELSVVNLTDMFFTLSNNFVCKAAFGRKYIDEGGDFEKLIVGTANNTGYVNIEDVIPWMGWINRFNGVNARYNEIGKGLDDVIERIIQEHVDRRKEITEDSKENEDFVDILLEVQTKNERNTLPLKHEEIKAVIFDMFAAGTHTNHVTLEWTFTELMRHPRIMRRLQEEVRGVAGVKDIVTESDLENMAYLKAVIKESFRLHPAIPLPIPRECIEETKFNGYDIPVGTQVIFNVWSIGRDPTYWEEPEKFMPERFLDSPIDFRGQHCELIPFGGGRRGCPGISFSVAGIELAIANFVYRFDWSLPNGEKCESIDISESPGSFSHKNTPLIVVPKPWLEA